MTTVEDADELSRRDAWLIAARPQTLPAAVSPVLVGTGLAVHDDRLALLPALVALVGAVLIQVGTNFANDYYDAVNGADTDAREGFTRVTAGGLIEPRSVKRATWLTFGTAVAVGGYLVGVGGVPIVVVGLLSVASGVAYTGGPYPLGYHGLGDPFVFVFFGLVAVVGSYYVQAAAVVGLGAGTVVPPATTVPAAALVAALPVAGVSTAILVVNNVRDRAEDAETGKRTLAVRLGTRFSRVEWSTLVGMAYVVPVVFAVDARFGAPVLAPLATLPLAAVVGRTVWTRTDGAALNPALERTGQLLAAHSALFALGLALA